MSVKIVIPARGGSKGLPRKNLSLLGGKTLLARCIRTCQQSTQGLPVYVSTEDDQIAVEAWSHWAEVIRRPTHLATDDAVTSDVLMHALESLQKQPECLVLCQCTSPFLVAADICNAIAKWRCTGAPLVIGVRRTHGLYLDCTPDGIVGVNCDLADMVTRRQDRAATYEISGAVWAIDVQKFLERGTLYCTDCEISECVSAFEIDTHADLSVAQACVQTGVIHG